MTKHDLIVAKIIAALEMEAIKLGAPADCLKNYTPDKYKKEIQDAVRQFWREGSRGNFITRMKPIVRLGLRDAWDQGAQEIGITPEDYTDDDIKARDAIVAEETSHIWDLVDYLESVARAGGTLDQAQSRLDTWAMRYPDVVGRAKVIMGKDQKLEWVYGDTEHCTSCKRLNGIVKRASFWKKAGVLPKNPPNSKLRCKGFRCQCQLVPTDKPLRRGMLPRLP